MSRDTADLGRDGGVPTALRGGERVQVRRGDLQELVLNTDERRYLVTQGLANIAVTQGYHSDFSGRFAGLTISILPVLAVYLVFHQQISTGMTAGALK